MTPQLAIPLTFSPFRTLVSLAPTAGTEGRWLKYVAVRRCLTIINAEGCYKTGYGKGHCVTVLNKDKAFKQGTVS